MRDIVLGVVAALALAVSMAPADSASRDSDTAVAPDNEGAFRQIVIHVDPAALDVVGPTYRDLLLALEPDVGVRVVVAERAHFDRFLRLLETWEVADLARFEPVITDRRITTWSRDRYVLVERDGQRILLVPPRPGDGHQARRNEWLVPFDIAATMDDVTAESVPLVFDGGDIIATPTHIFATALLLKRNEGGALGEKAELIRWLARATGRIPVIIGDHPDQVPPHHIGMFVTPLSGRTMLVGDPDKGLALLTAAQIEALGVDTSDEALARFRRVATDLETAGFDVIRVPLIPLDDPLTYVTYNNSILERRADGRLHAYVPQFGVLALDGVGRAAYEAAGVIVHPIDVSAVFRNRGTVRCLVNVLRRTPPRWYESSI